VLIPNPFNSVTSFLPAGLMESYVILMVIAVVVGTLFDMWHKGSAKFFLQKRRESEAAATRLLGGANKASLAARTILKEVAAAGEFCNPKRRYSHLLLFYGFLLYLITTIVMVFCYPTLAMPTPFIVPLLWNIGALMVLVGGYWFFFLIRVDVAHEGHSPFRLVRADLFIVSLLASVTFALIWEIVQLAGNSVASEILFAIYIFFTTLLFVGVPWSKFAHMFYKPAAAFQRRVEEASGSSKLPKDAVSGGKQCPPSHT
jgi:hypothetical protein